jgi:DNA-directed RNA polymerase, mitochondrial
MKYFQKLARAMAHENKPLRWTTPVGLPWVNAYNKPDTKQVKLWLHDRAVRIPYTTKLAVSERES